MQDWVWHYEGEKKMCVCVCGVCVRACMRACAHVRSLGRGCVGACACVRAFACVRACYKRARAHTRAHARVLFGVNGSWPERLCARQKGPFATRRGPRQGMPLRAAPQGPDCEVGHRAFSLRLPRPYPRLGVPWRARASMGRTAVRRCACARARVRLALARRRHLSGRERRGAGIACTRKTEITRPRAPARARTQARAGALSTLGPRPAGCRARWGRARRR